MKLFQRTKVMLILFTVTAFFVGLSMGQAAIGSLPNTQERGGKMDLGRFSVSLAVKDIKKSREFYEKLGFVRVEGRKEGDQSPPGTDWVVLQNGEAKIGLFQGMFDKNIMTFNPTDIRSIKVKAEKQGINLELQNMYGPLTETSPAYATLNDPDGNMILIDQLPEK